MGCDQSKPQELQKAVDTTPPPNPMGKTERLLSKRLQKQQQPEDESIALSHNSLSTAQVVQRTEQSVLPLFSTVHNGTTTLNYAWRSQRGFYPDAPHKENQDTLLVLDNFGQEDNDCLLGVLDGHGDSGHVVSRYATTHLPKLLSKYVKQKRASLYRPVTGQPGFCPQAWPHLNREQYQQCCSKAFVQCNQQLHAAPQVADKFSGTTATTVHFHSDFVTICNVGDSRCVLGKAIVAQQLQQQQQQEEETKEEISHYDEEESDNDKPNHKERIVAIPLSHDQTPYRKDERQRIRDAGGVVQTLDQQQGVVTDTVNEDDWDKVVLGNTCDYHGDPPRVWVSNQSYPGCAFTRSLGDSVADDIGVHAQPEILTTKLCRNDKYLVIASDGIFEFLTNQAVIDICRECDSPIMACQSLVQVAHEQWLLYENRTDDISVIVVFLDNDNEPLPGTTEDLLVGSSSASVSTTSTTSSSDSLCFTPSKNRRIYEPSDADDDAIVLLNHVPDGNEESQ